MRTAVLYGVHDFKIEDLPVPQISPDQCLIKVKACGVCHSEIHQWDEKIPSLDYPRYIGHEVAGIIEEKGKQVKNLEIGEHVAVWVDGKGYAEKIAVAADRIFPLARRIPFEQAMAEPLSCTMNAMHAVNIQLGDTVVLAGTGFMGLLLLQKIKLAGAGRIVAIDLRDELLELAATFGADRVINPQRESAADIVRDMTEGKGADVCFEVGGVQGTLDLAAQLCRMEGKLVIFGFHPGPRQINDLGYWNWMAFRIINAHFRDLGEILHGCAAGMKLLNLAKLNMAPLITHTYPLEEINLAFTAAKEKPKGFVKAVLVF